METQFGEVGNLKLIKIIYTTKGKGWFFHLYSKGFELTSTSAEMHQLANLHGFNECWAQTTATLGDLTKFKPGTPNNLRGITQHKIRQRIGMSHLNHQNYCLAYILPGHSTHCPKITYSVSGHSGPMSNKFNTSLELTN